MVVRQRTEAELVADPAGGRSGQRDKGATGRQRANHGQATSDHRQRDYLFDLQGYLVLKVALAERDLDDMNRWLDDHWRYVQDPSFTRGRARPAAGEGLDRAHGVAQLRPRTTGANFQTSGN